MKKLTVLIGFLLIGVGIGLTIILVNNKRGLLLEPFVAKVASVPVVKKRMIVGFLPTWNIGKTKTYGKELDELVFSGVDVSDDGSLVWDAQSKKINNGDYLKLKANIKANGGKNILGIKLFEDDKIDSFLASEEAKSRLLAEVADEVKVGNFDGVNIDFEYMNNPIRILDDDFVSFLISTKTAGWKEIGIDGFANTILKGSQGGLQKLLNNVDSMVVMAYDFHRPGASQAGPVAPVNAEVGERSIAEILAKISDYELQKDKVVMAYPLYGYEWETETSGFGSATKTGGYGRTVQFKESVGFTGVSWNDEAMSPWLAFNQMQAVRKTVVVKKKKKTETEWIDQPHEVYFENKKSLELKIEMTKQAQIGGVGYWALGYEGMDSNLLSELRNEAWD